MLEEGAVLGGNEGPDDVVGHLVERGQLAALNEEFADWAALLVKHPAGQRGAVVTDGLEIGEIPNESDVERRRREQACHAEQADRREQDADPTRLHEETLVPPGVYQP